MSPFDKEVEKVGSSIEAVTSRWKTWGLAILGIFVASVVIYAIVKFWW